MKKSFIAFLVISIYNIFYKSLVEALLMTDEKNFKQRRKLDESPLYPPKTNEPEGLFEELKKCILMYHPSTDLSQIEKAYHVAENAHNGQ